MTTITEADVERAALNWLEGLDWLIAHGPDLSACDACLRATHRQAQAGIAPDTANAERSDYGQVILERRVRDALALFNPGLPATAVEDAFRKLIHPEGSTPESRNRAFHRMLVDGVTVEYRADNGAIRGAQARVIDFDDPVGNDWLAVNQFTVVENENSRRPDVVLFVNGLPLGVIELKNPADEDATVWTAWRQLQTYKAELPTLFSMNAVLMVSDGVEARVGTLTAGREWFKPWRTVSGETLADSHMPQLQVMLLGTCEQPRFLSLLRDFIVFEDDGSGALLKKMAGYHQFHAVQVAVGETLRAAKLQRAKTRIAQEGDGRLRVRSHAGRRDRRPAHRGGLAHPGIGQEPDHGLLRRTHHPRARHGKPDGRPVDRPERPRRPVVSAPSPVVGTFCASRLCRRRAGPTCGANCQSTPGAWCLRPSRSLCRLRRHPHPGPLPEGEGEEKGRHTYLRPLPA